MIGRPVPCHWPRRRYHSEALGPSTHTRLRAARRETEGRLRPAWALVVILPTALGGRERPVDSGHQVVYWEPVSPLHPLAWQASFVSSSTSASLATPSQEESFPCSVTFELSSSRLQLSPDPCLTRPPNKSYDTDGHVDVRRWLFGLLQGMSFLDRVASSLDRPVSLSVLSRSVFCLCLAHSISCCPATLCSHASSPSKE